jgi:hypothetical protein
MFAAIYHSVLTTHSVLRVSGEARCMRWLACCHPLSHILQLRFPLEEPMGTYGAVSEG